MTDYTKALTIEMQERSAYYYYVGNLLAQTAEHDSDDYWKAIAYQRDASMWAAKARSILAD